MEKSMTEENEVEESPVEKLFSEAFYCRDVEKFMQLLFPKSWGGVIARIVETGVTFSDRMCPWAPRWSKIPPTMRKGKTELNTHVKSCIFRVHDCFHQLFGIPVPSSSFTEEEFYLYKRAQMCGEVAVLTLTEFVFCKYLYDTYPEVKELMKSRNAMLMLEGPLLGKTTLEIALRMDDLLHKKSIPKWVRDHEPSAAFVADYVPMLETDRKDIDHNWNLMKTVGWTPGVEAPHVRFSKDLDGLELTSWMINDFYHLMATDTTVDESLRKFNEARRSKIILPQGWHLS